VASWTEIVGIGVAVGLLFSIVPAVWHAWGLARFVRYVNFDLIRLGQIIETEGFGGLAFPLSQKLSEKGVLLAWKAQREFEKMHVLCDQLGYPYEPGTFEELKGSLETYREMVGALSHRVGVLAWHAGDVFENPAPPFVRKTFSAIDRDWYEFRMHSAFLHKFMQRHTRVPTEKL
jgi:hypothetical protein